MELGAEGGDSPKDQFAAMIHPAIGGALPPVIRERG